MPDDPRLEGWLDRWEALRARGLDLSPDEFLAGFCGEIPAPLAGRFREQALALGRFDRRLEEADGRARGGPPAGGPPAPASPAAGQEPVPGHVLVDRLGRGGFGEVWKARGPGGFHVALKFVPLDHRAGTAELRALGVIRETRHPHLLAIFGAWQAGGHLIIAMELAQRSLLDRLREAIAQGFEGIPGPELAEYMREAAKGIDYLNEPRHPAGGEEPLGIQHRDVKPQNLLLVGGGVKVADFGLARLMEHSVTGHTGSMTPAYAAPEFFRLETSAQSDQYSLAVTYCHLRGGRLPFAGSPAEVMAGHVGYTPDLTMLPEAERPAVARALAKGPGGRWPGCRAFVAALDAARAGTEASAPGDALTPRARRASGGRRLAAALGLVALLAAAAVVARSGRDAPPPADAPGVPGPQTSPPLADREPAAPAPRPAGVPPASPGPAGADPGVGTREVAATTGRAAEPAPPPASGDLASAHLIRGRLLWDRRDLDEAIAELSAAIRLDPRLAAAYYFRGCCHAARLDQDRAIADYDEVERLEPGRVGNRYMRGWAYTAKGQHRRAIADLDEAIRLEPRNAGAYLRRSTAHARLGDRARADADRRRALQLDPGVEERVLRGRGGTGSSPR